MYTELKNTIVLQDSANLGKETLFTFCEWFANSTVEEDRANLGKEILFTFSEWFANSTVEETAGQVNLQG